jgi:hypothetical protein
VSELTFVVLCFVVDVATSCHACIEFLSFVILKFRLLFLSLLSRFVV